MHYSRIKIYLAFCSFLPIFHGKAQLVQKNVGNPDSLFEAFIVSAKQLNLDSINNTSINYSHQYYYLLYGNGRDFGKNGDSLEGLNWFTSPKDYEP